MRRNRQDFVTNSTENFSSRLLKLASHSLPEAERKQRVTLSPDRDIVAALKADG
jgi:hypothetical protein